MRAVIFDYGNVLCQPQHDSEIGAMAAILKLPRERFETMYWQHRLDYDEAKLEAAEYWNNFAPVTAAEIEQLNRLDGASWTYPNIPVVNWARQLQKSGLKIALLSNMPFPIRDAVLGCNWLPEFDQRTFSCELGISKPSREIYEHCLHSLGVPGDQALFVDDKPANVQGAAAAGMHGIVFSSASDLGAELAKRFDTFFPGIATLKKGP